MDALESFFAAAFIDCRFHLLDTEKIQGAFRLYIIRPHRNYFANLIVNYHFSNKKRIHNKAISMPTERLSSYVVF